MHIIPAGDEGHPLPATALKESIDHVAFHFEGYGAFREKLNALGIRYSLMDLADIQERQVFIPAPRGLLVKVVFSEMDYLINRENKTPEEAEEILNHGNYQP